MKYMYFYSNNSICKIDNFDEYDILNDMVGNFITHSKEVSNKTINKEKKDNKYLHIFKEHKINGCSIWKWFASYVLD